jgi:DNA-binding MarR family transcriptional regulator
VEDERYNSYSFLLDRTARRVKQYAQQQFNELGLNITVDQWLVLKHLDSHGPMTQRMLAELMFKDNPTLTRILDLMCEKKLVVRNTHPSDRRSFMISLTADGKKKISQLKPKVRLVRLKAWEGLSEKDFSQFQKILNTIYRNLSPEGEE